VARMGEESTRFRWEGRKERDHSEDRGVDGRVESEWILREIGWGCRVDTVGSGYGPQAGCCKYCDEPSGSGATELELALLIGFRRRNLTS
jgi:hypothetical protein